MSVGLSLSNTLDLEFSASIAMQEMFRLICGGPQFDRSHLIQGSSDSWATC